MRQFKLSNDPRFVDKLRDVVGLYVDPPAHAVVLSVDEKRSHGANSDWRSGRVRLSNHPPWRRPCELQLTDPKLRRLSGPILVRFSCRWN
jgi:hypothetical protein